MRASSAYTVKTTMDVRHGGGGKRAVGCGCFWRDIPHSCMYVLTRTHSSLWSPSFFLLKHVSTCLRSPSSRSVLSDCNFSLCSLNLPLFPLRSLKDCAETAGGRTVPSPPSCPKSVYAFLHNTRLLGCRSSETPQLVWRYRAWELDIRIRVRGLMYSHMWACLQRCVSCVCTRIHDGCTASRRV